MIMISSSPRRPAYESRSDLPGSERELPKGAVRIGKASGTARIEVTVLLKNKVPLPSLAALGDGSHEPLTRAQFATQYGASTADLAAIDAFAHHFGLTVVESSAEKRTVRLSGTVDELRRAFGVQLGVYRQGRTRFRGRRGSVRLPDEIIDLVAGVFGLDDRPAARWHSYWRPLPDGRATRSTRATAGPRPFTPPEVAALYEFPRSVDGAGQCIALIELGGGYRPADLRAYFKSLRIDPPAVSAVSVAGGRNEPSGNPAGPDGEVMLDIEVAGAVAPGARIAVYFAPNTDAGFLNALLAAVHDRVRRPTVVSISWGGPEYTWTAQALRAFDEACQIAATMGITVCCSAGDNGAQDRAGQKRGNVDFPAASPFVLACGGTRLIARGEAIGAETVWNDGDGWATGGGISEHFPVPAYQSRVRLPASVNGGAAAGRGVPDVSGNADGETGYRIRVDGAEGVIGGTSAVSPLWAGLIALLNQAKGHNIGFLTPRLYQLGRGSRALRDIVSGNNAALRGGKGYAAAPGWDACTGLGSPNGERLLELL